MLSMAEAGGRYLAVLGAWVFLAGLAPGMAGATEWCVPLTAQEAYDTLLAAAGDGSALEAEAVRIGDETRAQGTFESDGTLFRLDDLAYEWAYRFDCDRGVYVYAPEATGDNDPVSEEPCADDSVTDEEAETALDGDAGDAEAFDESDESDESDELDDADDADDAEGPEQAGPEANKTPPQKGAAGHLGGAASPAGSPPPASSPAPATVPGPPGAIPSAPSPAPAPDPPTTPGPQPSAVSAVATEMAVITPAPAEPPGAPRADTHRPPRVRASMAASSEARTSAPAPLRWLLLAVPATVALAGLLLRRRLRPAPRDAPAV